MITDEILKLHDELEKKATPRPWASAVRKRPGYGRLIFWELRPYREVIFDCEDDAKYMAFARNIMPELVRELRELRAKLAKEKSDVG